MLKIFFTLSFFLHFCFCNRDEAFLQESLAITLTPEVALQTTSLRSSSSLKQIQKLQHKALYQNSTHVALEFNVPSAKARQAVYINFINSVGFLQPFLAVDPSFLSQFIRRVGKQSVAKINAFKSNLSVELIKPAWASAPSRLRLFVQRRFKTPQFSRAFPGDRVGLTFLNRKIANMYAQCFNKAKSLLRSRPVCNSQKLSYHKLFDYWLYFKPQEGLYILEATLCESDSPQELQAKHSFLNSQERLLLSRKLLRGLGIHGFYNHDAGSDITFDLHKFDGNPLFATTFKKTFNDLSLLTDKPSLNFIRKNCERKTNKPIAWSSLGVPRPERAISRPGYKFTVFENHFELNYVFGFATLADVDKVDIWNAAVQELGVFHSCSFHNDNYYMPIELNEMYLITFTLLKTTALKSAEFVM